MRQLTVLRHFVAVLFLALLAGLGGCIVIPDTYVRQDRMSYAAIPLLTLPDGKVAYLLQDCLQSSWRPGEPFRCDRAANHLAVRPAEWDLLAEVRAKLGNRTPGTGFALDDQLGILAGRDYLRPASAQHDTAAIFVGYFTGVGFVWVRPDAAAGRWRYEVVRQLYSERESFRPAMVVRDGDDVWIFVERDSSCNDDLCHPVAATLGLAESDLPEDLRGGFMLYHATIARGAFLQRVIPVELQRFLEEGPLPLPRADRPYQTDFHRQGAVDITTHRPDVLCLIRSATTEYFYFPLGSKQGDSTTQLRACEIFAPIVPAGQRLLPANRPEQPRTVFDDPLVHRARSSYYCWPGGASGLAQYGKGRYACSFVMRDPETQAALPNTPYLIWLQGANGADLQVKGTTNAQGRTAVVRSEQPIILRHLRVSRRVGPADLRPAAEAPAWKGRSVVAEAVGKHLVRATDGQGIPGQSYRMQVCSGRTLDAQTDEAGWTVAYDAPKGPACPVQFIFGSAERSREN